MVHSEISFPVRYYETDQMGIVHHSNYIRYFECARNNLMVECGYPIEKCEEDGVTIPIVTVECRYRFPAKMGDVVRAVAMIDEVPMAKLRVRQAVYNQDGTLCVEAPGDPWLSQQGYRSADTLSGEACGSDRGSYQ